MQEQLGDVQQLISPALLVSHPLSPALECSASVHSSAAALHAQGLQADTKQCPDTPDTPETPDKFHGALSVELLPCTCPRSKVEEAALARSL